MKRPFRRKRLDRWLNETIDSANLLGLTREDGDELLFEAKRRLDAGESEAARRLFAMHTRSFGLTADGLLGLGSSLQANGDHTSAIRAYLDSLERRTTDPFAWANLLECSLLTSFVEGVRQALEGLATCDRQAIAPDLAQRIETLEAMANDRLGQAESPHTQEVASGLTFAVEPDLSAPEFVDLLERSTLAARRPIAEPGAIDGMLANADLIVTARTDGLLIGISRAITDYHFCTYLSDLAVDREHQRRGIGKELISRTHEAAGLKTTLILLAAPAAREYYPHIGMTAHDSCWIIPRTPSKDEGPPK